LVLAVAAEATSGKVPTTRVRAARAPNRRLMRLAFCNLESFKVDLSLSCALFRRRRQTTQNFTAPGRRQARPFAEAEPTLANARGNGQRSASVRKRTFLAHVDEVKPPDRVPCDRRGTFRGPNRGSPLQWLEICGNTATCDNGFFTGASR
jgi:hypothetical protein